MALARLTKVLKTERPLAGGFGNWIELMPEVAVQGVYLIGLIFSASRPPAVGDAHEPYTSSADAAT